MNAVRLSLTAQQLPDNYHRLRSAIESAVPVGFNMHKRDSVKRSTVDALQNGLFRIMDKYSRLNKMQLGKARAIILSNFAWMKTRISGLCCIRVVEVWVMP